MKRNMTILVIAISVLMLTVSTSAAQEINADDFGVNDASGDQGTIVPVPVEITNLQNGPLAGIIFDVSYDSNILELTSMNVERGALTSGWDAPSFNPANGRISIVFRGVGTEIPNDSSG